eukprot:TRINITY_DN13626_c0_g1_i1.p1 TRINITY_DN13626_c0_g1~~TRINITY_DN13626_c0_g1_i1.p1  ORF type:complete len:311 (-),score=77.48 TRINITY_DN13626_c0_g1_i1:352-1191(-)
MYDFLVSNPLVVRLISNSKKRQKKRKMARKATRQETLQRRKVVYRDAMEEDDSESPQQQQQTEPASQLPPMSAQEAEKLKKLEDELARLRSEMAKFLNAAGSQQQSASDDNDDLMTPQKSYADPEAGFRTPAPVRKSTSSIPAPPPLPNFSNAAGAPPPPPPPMPCTPKASYKSSTQDYADKENQINSTPSTPARGAPETPKPSLADLVRNASQRGSLRRVDGERSPGGTLKRKPSTSNGPASNNHTDVIAHALRMKFKNMHRDSPVSSPDKTFDNESM